MLQHLTFLALFSICAVYCSLEETNDLSFFFLETFDKDTDVFRSKWTKSSNEKYSNQPVMIKSADMSAPGFERDKGLSLTQEMKFYGVSSRFPQPLSLDDDGSGSGPDDLVIQYELKLEESLSCGGAYLKLPRYTVPQPVEPAADTSRTCDGDIDIDSDSASGGNNCNIKPIDSNNNNNDLKQLDSKTPYSIMFGPDRCGTDNDKVHFIIQHQNPISKTWEEKHYNSPPAIINDQHSHLYTLAIYSTRNIFEIFIDKKSVRQGHLLRDMIPPIYPNAIIDDPDDKKPTDWIDEDTIPDPNAIKPSHWNDDAPRTIVDIRDIQPADWDENAHDKTIPAPNAVKPADWDDEEDGIWECPTIPNPQCDVIAIANAAGSDDESDRNRRLNSGSVADCGVWKARKIPNPEYRGAWSAPLIDNPLYKGPWKPRKITNPYYFSNPLNDEAKDFGTGYIAPMNGVAIEVWTTNAGIHFDNILITRSISTSSGSGKSKNRSAFPSIALESAFTYAARSFDKKQTSELQQLLAARQQARAEMINTLKSSGVTSDYFKALWLEYSVIMILYWKQVLGALAGMILGLLYIWRGGRGRDSELMVSKASASSSGVAAATAAADIDDIKATDAVTDADVKGDYQSENEDYSDKVTVNSDAATAP